MSKNKEQNNQSIELEDLVAHNTEEIKGGPKKIFIGGLSATDSQAALPDLEPQGEIKGGPIYMKYEGINGSVTSQR
jgi:hypothetical protein